MAPRDTANPRHSGLQRVKAGLGTIKQKFTQGASRPASVHPADSEEPSRVASIADTDVDTLILAADMVEKIANVVSKVPVIAPVAALVSEVFKTVKDVREMRGNRDTLHTKLRDKMNDFSAATSQEGSYNHATERLQEDLKIYRGLLEEASKLVSDFDDKGSLKTTVQYPLWKQKFDDLEKKIHSFEGRFILNRVTDIQMAQTEKDLREKLHKWLQAPPDMTSKQDELQSLRHEDTGSWFLNGPKFREWKANPGSLWIRGNSGTGKSVLCSTVIGEAFADNQPPPAVAYFYFDVRDEEIRSQRLKVMLRSIVFQLSARSSPPYVALRRLHNELSDVPPRDEHLLKVLDELISELGRPYVVLDALDECNEADHSQLIQFIQRLVGDPAQRPLHFLFTSQPRRVFLEGFPDVTYIDLGASTTTNDIQLFVKRGVSGLKSWANRSEEVTQHVVKQVVDKSNGMFRLSACLLKELSHCHWSKEWEETLNDLPSDLAGIYTRFLGRVPRKHLVYVQAIFRWILVSARPITLDELADAIAFDFSDPAGFIYDPSRREGNTSAIFAWLDGLIVVTKDWRRSVALAHASVQDYILSKQYMERFAAGVDFTERTSHKLITQTCVHYLLYFGDPENPLNAETSPNYPLWAYVTRYWFYHFQRCDGPDATFASTRPLLEGGSSQYGALNHLHEVTGQGYSPEWRCSVSSPLNVCSAIGYTDGVHFILSKNPGIDTAAGEYTRALRTASAAGHKEIVQLLLQRGETGSGDNIKALIDTAWEGVFQTDRADIIELLLDNGTEVGGQGVTPLQTAASEGCTQIVRLLLDKGADLYPTSGSRPSRSPLEMASQKGHTEIVQMFLEDGAIATIPDGTLGSALELASRDGHAETVRMLLNRGAMASARDEEVGSVLQSVSRDGHTEIVRRLLEHGAIARASDEKVGGALQMASRNGHTESVRMLLEHGAIPRARDEEVGSALQLASRDGHTEIVRTLLEHGAMARTSDENVGGALHLASRDGHTEIVRMLLEDDALARAPEGKLGSALALASRDGRTEIVLMLLEHGAIAGAWDGDVGSALALASRDGHTEIVLMLLEKGAIAVARDADVGSALELASRDGHAEIVRMLLDHGAISRAPDEDVGGALRLASREGHLEIVRMLLADDAIAGAPEGKRGDALEMASRDGRTEIVRMLLAQGAIADGKAGSALEFASSYGHTEIVRMLLDHGAISRAPDEDVGGALKLASMNGHTEIARMLLEDDAIVRAPDEKVGSAVELASSHGHQEILLLLLQHGANAA
ncbi:ankyrin repeat-containing domain protein [Mycena maculata]|uniref:Ankyrin repeat-containing domain protein n=1 Tax=Mycena maculata TaxID=230809 RepID=A0AAD7HKL9_9AGAR|nr:ankyrin repeat-containing domain protein [Mycena maculata]